MHESKDTKVGRREFVGLAAAATAGITIMKPSTAFGAQANSAVRLGLLGCGGRGTAVTESFLSCFGPTLFGGSWLTAYAAPPREMKSAAAATTTAALLVNRSIGPTPYLEIDPAPFRDYMLLQTARKR